jgi:dCTP deaminase
MILSDQDIRQAITSGRIGISPALDYDTQLGSCSVDFRLGNVFRVFANTKHAYIDPQNSQLMSEIMEEVVVPEGEAFVMRPGEFVLAVTVEHLTLPDDLLGRIEGRSSLGRIGIIVHGTASLFDPGWIGNPVLELGNLGVMPVKLYPGMRICSFTFEELTSATSQPYHLKKSAKYVNQQGTDASRYDQEMGHSAT